MLHLTLKGLWAHKLRYALTGLAVVLGVAFMAGTLVLTDTMEATFNDVIGSANEGTDVIVRSESSIDGDSGEARERIDASVVDEIEAVDGVEAAHGSIQGFAQLVTADGEAEEANGPSVTIGANWVPDEGLNPFRLDSGRAPVRPAEMVLDAQTAEAEGWALGDEVSLLSLQGPTRLELVGTVTYGAVDGLPGTSLVATDDATAQELFGEPGKFDLVVVAAADGVSAADLTDRLAESLDRGEGLEVVTGEQDTADKQADLKEDLSFFSSFLLAFAYIALFVGTFIIYNTFSIVVAQRVKDLALLRAIGASRGQVLRSVVLESVLVGVVAAAVGLVAGIGLSFGLRALLAGVGLDLPSGDIVVASGTVVTAFVVGLAVSVGSAIVPALRASRVRPIAALRDGAADGSGASISRVATGVAVTVGGASAFAAGVTATGDAALRLIGLGAVSVILGISILGPVLVRPALRLMGAPLSRLGGVTGRYARENARRSPKRTAATASALMIGVGLVGFITILAASTNASVEAAVDRSFRGDYVIDSGSWSHGFAPSIEDDLRSVPQVDELSPLRVAPVEIDGAGTDVVGVDTSVVDEMYDLQLTEGDLADVHGDAVAVKADEAAAAGLVLGDTVSMRFADGSRVDAPIRAIYETGFPASGESWIIGLDAFEAHVADQYDRQVWLTVAGGASAADTRTAIESAVSEWPNAEIQDQAELKESITAEVAELLNLVYGLLALAVIIALIGIANTLALSIHERTRELGLLRAVGMHRRQLRTAVRWESVLIAVLGALAGALLAVGGAWGIVHALNDEGITQLTIPANQLATIMAAAGVAGVLAAGGPARRAAKLDILGAIATH